MSDKYKKEYKNIVTCRSRNIKSEDLVSTPTGKTVEETVELLMEQHRKAVAEHKRKQSKSES